jgi:hypothetical protein
MNGLKPTSKFTSGALKEVVSINLDVN